MANCIVCGKEYTPKRKDQKWCCEECKKKYRNDKRRKEHPDKVCKYCGKSFSPKKDTQNFCCKRCREKYFEENRPKREYKVKCSECGKEFVASRNKTEKENLKFCCKKCRDLYRKKHEKQIECPTCKKKFSPYRKNQKFCSRLCRDIDKYKTFEDIEFNESFIKHYVRGRKPVTTLTKPHLKVDSYLDELNISYENEVGKGRYSLDIYLKEYNLAIEIMGTYWHCDRRYYSENKLKYRERTVIEKDKRKRKNLKEKWGIEILYIWEDETKNEELCKQLIQKFIRNEYLPSNMSSKYNLKNGSLHYCKNYKKQYMEFNNNFLLQPERLNEKTS